MIKLPNGILVTETSELPNFVGAKDLFLDVETKRVFDDNKLGGFYPWKGDRTCGIAVTADDCEEAFYVPIRHTRGGNLPLDNVLRWLKDHLTGVENWVNHNVGFDAMFCAVGDGVHFDCNLIDTLTLSKLHDTDRIGHNLKLVCEEYLGFDVSAEKEVKAYLDGIKSKNYADVPCDILGKYAIDDIRMNRDFYKFLKEKRPERMEGIWETEKLLAPVLFDMEYEGLQINRQQWYLSIV